MQPAVAERRPELDLAGLGREREAALRRDHVDPLVGSARTRVAEVVGVAHRAEHREDDLLRRSCARPGREGDEEEKEKSDPRAVVRRLGMGSGRLEGRDATRVPP